MPLEVARHGVGDRTLIRVRLVDRRSSGLRAEEFLFQNQVEYALYGCNSGALYRLYQRCTPRLRPPPAPPRGMTGKSRMSG